MRRVNPAAIVMLGGCLSFSTGCHSATESEADDTGGNKDYPAIHATWLWEQVTDGKNLAREAYAMRLETCKAAGWPVKELMADEIARLDTGKVELWTDARGAYGRQTSWTLGVMDKNAALNGKGVCLSKLEEEVVEGDDDYSGRDAPDSAPDAAEQDALAKVLGFQRIGESQVKGQLCTRWRNKDHEVCEWSGGRAWGFDDAPVQPGCATQGPMDYLNPIPLEAKPAEGASGCIVQLQSMTISKGQLPEVKRALGATETGD